MTEATITPGVSPPRTPDTAASAAVDDLTNTSLEELQTDEQRRVLDTVARVRKCGLEGTVSLPQIVVVGDQSAGKSSVLEAVTGIPLPRSDNLCTRYASEISLRLANTDSITVKVIPGPDRTATEQVDIKAFEESITNFAELPRIMDMAMKVMGIGTEADATTKSDVSVMSRAFSRDVLSIEIFGPGRPQLTLVDIPGLIGAETKATTKADIALVAGITKHYIEQPRTICLAVVSAATDYANQTILERVREVDPEGERTLGVITKPDIPPAGSGLEKSYIELARNEDIFFKLGWHVVKNRKFDERDASLEERNQFESSFFVTSNWSCLPPESVGIEALRRRLSILLFEHVKKELPKLREELDLALVRSSDQLVQLGPSRSTGSDCKAYLTQLSLDYHEICKAAVDGHYEAEYFHIDVDPNFSVRSPSTLRRTRAMVQKLNLDFAKRFETVGHKYRLPMTAPSKDEASKVEGNTTTPALEPKLLNKSDALDWVRKALIRNRGKELVGNFNPLLIGELFWEQSEKWEKLAGEYVDTIAALCRSFLRNLLEDLCSDDVRRRVWSLRIQDALKVREQAAKKELSLLIEDHRNYPINYNHYYTDNISKCRQERQKEALKTSIASATSTQTTYPNNTTVQVTKVDVDKVVANYSQNVDPNMDNFSCEEALDCLIAIYKVSQKTFVANVTMQVIERHIVRGLDKIFSPIFVNGLTSEQAEALASEPPASKRKREYLEDQIRKLEEGQEIFKNVL
ncbi:Interferon-induced GTP-binding protein [Lachnellula occidentalis]|uniref:Interferon-induced GTP-binding protein n=1 Tax=Lachnellula occidentalis TaxID=215460 RepID=A0A8H8S6Z4_9HELO|nr:Interferon-induced GTP-binding protein [Lachnellula occidentalis]